MELILINDKKLKIMLSPEDVAEFELDCESADYDKTETRRAFWHILDEVKRKTGFDAASERVYIQLYPSREGGCEMYVTKVGLLPAACKTQKRGMLRVASERSLLYRFDGLAPMLAVCRELSNLGFSAPSDAFVDEGGSYYLYINGVRGFSMPTGLAFISEFGENEDAEAMRGYINEHAHPICTEDAIKTLGALA